jgi:hypothetical protein
MHRIYQEQINEKMLPKIQAYILKSAGRQQGQNKMFHPVIVFRIL